MKEIAAKIEDSHRLNNNGPADNNFRQNRERDVIQCFIRGLSPKLEIRVVEKDTFKELINDTIGIERRLAANSSLRRIRNTDYLKTEESTNNKNNKTARFNVALEDKTICLICKKLGHTTEKCFHSSKAQDAVLNNTQQNFLCPNQQRYNNFNGQRNSDNNFARKFPNNNFLRNENYNFNNKKNHFCKIEITITEITIIIFYNNNSGLFRNQSKPYGNRFLQNNNIQRNSNYTKVICDYCKKPGHLIRDCKIRPSNQSQAPHQENSKSLPSTDALRKA